MDKKFITLIKITIVAVYLIFLAGSVVRMTGSGMGCPDWPKCFGYYIPPTSEEQITWHPNTSYNKGMIIVKEEVLFVAQEQITSGEQFDASNWEKYTKHDYAKFNKFHTWTEYINRLTSALAGIPFLLLAFFSVRYWKTNKAIPLLTFGGLFLVFFNAWLGKLVVDTNLKPTVITTHMVAGLLTVAVLLALLYVAKNTLIGKETRQNNKLFSQLLIVSAIFSLIQIALGTQVRQFIDEQVKLHGFDNKQLSLLAPNVKFYIHRSFTIAIVLVNFGLFYINQIKNLGFNLINWVVALIVIEALTGILMYYAEFPLGTQAIHLLSGAVLFGLQFYLWLESRKVH